ncbi:MAG: hypothetical protein U5J78_03225 [Parasphingorhabdus sp.]|nr:hypothetical protein [Parasphingorhabdus sp.]
MEIQGSNGAQTNASQSGAIASGDNQAARVAADPVATLAQQSRTGSPVEQGQALRQLDQLTGNRVTTDAVASGKAPPEMCTIEVRYKPVVGPTNHAFIVTTDGDSQNYFRGGPASNANGLNSPSASSRGRTPDGERQPFDAQFGIYGPIVTESGAYVDPSVDWTTNPSGQQIVATTAGNCDAIERQFANAANDIEASRTNYQPLGPNSNSTVREILERSGYDDVNPVVWSPGWNTQIPMAR